MYCVAIVVGAPSTMWLPRIEIRSTLCSKHFYLPSHLVGANTVHALNNQMSLLKLGCPRIIARATGDCMKIASFGNQRNSVIGLPTRPYQWRPRMGMGRANKTFLLVKSYEPVVWKEGKSVFFSRAKLPAIWPRPQKLVLHPCTYEQH